MESTRPYILLAAAGVLPFVACALMPPFGLTRIEPLGSFDEIAASYGLAIVSFLAGVHWATCLYRGDQAPAGLLVLSNVVTVAAWIAFLAAGTALALGVIVLAFLVLLLVDLRLFQTALITGPYFGMRAAVTAVAIAALLATIAQV